MTEGEFDFLVSIVADHFGLYGRLLKNATTMTVDLGADDIDRREVLATLEEVFALRFTADQMHKLNTIDDIAKAIDERDRVSDSFEHGVK